MLSEEEVQKGLLEKQEIIMKELSTAYLNSLDTEMGKLHNQFVAFISSSKLPLPQVALVLEILLRETVDHAMKKYIGSE